MPYEARWDPRVPEGLRTLPEPERKRVVSAILALADEPAPVSARQLPRPRGALRLEAARFSILYVLDSRAHTVIVYAVLKDGVLLNPGSYRIDA